MMLGAEIGVRSHKPRTTRGTSCRQKAREGHGIDSPTRSSAETNPVDTVILDFWPAGRESKREISVLSSAACGALLGPPRETGTAGDSTP